MPFLFTHPETETSKFAPSAIQKEITEKNTTEENKKSEEENKQDEERHKEDKLQEADEAMHCDVVKEWGCSRECSRRSWVSLRVKGPSRRGTCEM